LTWRSRAGGEISFRVIDKNRIDEGKAVTWVLNGEFVEVQSASGPAPVPGVAGADNLLDCQIQEILSLGETSVCSMTPEGLAGERITLQLPGQMVRRGQWQPGSRVRLSIAPQALHIMPLK